MKKLLKQLVSGNKSIFGLMLESNLFSGKQKILDNKDDMQYGVSVTDGCIDWKETEEVIRSLAKAISKIEDELILGFTGQADQ